VQQGGKSVATRPDDFGKKGKKHARWRVPRNNPRYFYERGQTCAGSSNVGG